MPLRHIASLSEWENLKNSNNRIVAHFGANWCEPCVAVNEWLEGESGHHPDVLFAYIDGAEHMDIADAEQVTAVPYIVFYRREGSKLEPVAEVGGAKLKELEYYHKHLLDPSEQRANHASMEEFLKYQIGKDHIVIFITGTPSRPRCGFTGRLVELLSKYNVSYSFYDVMSDDEACQALKTISDWPTYPQVYVNKELIGGMDIIQQLHDKGELEKVLAPPEHKT